MFSRLKLKCDYVAYGCPAILRLENLNNHLQECEYNPKKPIICSLGCNILIAKDELKSHNCIKELRKIVDDQQSKINHLSNEVMRQKNELDTYINELRVLKGFASKYFRISPNLSSSPSVSNLNLTDDDDIVR